MSPGCTPSQLVHNILIGNLEMIARHRCREERGDPDSPLPVRALMTLTSPAQKFTPIGYSELKQKTVWEDVIVLPLPTAPRIGAATVTSSSESAVPTLAIEALQGSALNSTA
ncbi:hypothetical protein ISF_02585 [Cordyceps fumosorosea ARSEF 2679]|uniref:Uncharacterized protein n=1 Tax=Cordyceps fumosorosea (strain ARSEF 2679) TaxID=1081104 RepID=A0A168BVV5_CORFA|nr:hypothetical protein ISF_02585 [Cordyceps fumosorosea ARSEF 2679]OAA70611.1 hypothetical protein ISF_02585 [Cordyceps fumosorosea ARSEF 2679]